MSHSHGRVGPRRMLSVLGVLAGLVGSMHAQDALFRRGDANGDGVVDVADAGFMTEFYFRGAVGRPTCLQTLDVNDDGEWVDYRNTLYLLNFLFLGTSEPPAPGPYEPGPDPDGDPCDTYLPVEALEPPRFRFSFECPGGIAAAPGEPAEVFLTLTTTSDHDLGFGALGWSVSVGAESLRFRSIATEGTAADDITADPPGLRVAGYAHSEAVDPLLDVGDGPQGQGVVSAVVLQVFPDFSGLDPTWLPSNGTVRIARLLVELDPDLPLGAGETARLFYEDGKQGSGQPVPNLVAFNGTAQVPQLEECVLVIGDCNGNDVDDARDIQLGTSTDCDGNLVPDECQLRPETDCNSNGVPDTCDLATGTSEDCNENGIPDDCELDCNSNGVPDDCDLAAGTSADCNENGIPDDCEPDCDADGIPDECDPAPVERDCNLNGLADSLDIASGRSADDDATGIPDECEQAPLPEFTLALIPDPDVVSCGGEIAGPPGTTMEIDCQVILQSGLQLLSDFEQLGFLLSLGGEDVSFGAANDTGFDPAGDALPPGTPCSFPLGTGATQLLVDPEREVAEGGTGCAPQGLEAGLPQGEGIAYFRIAFEPELPALHEVPVVAFRVAVQVPEVGEPPVTARVLFVDGKRGSHQPVYNSVSARGMLICPELRECTFTVSAAPTGPRFVRGDVDGDGEIGGTVTDIIYYTNWAFLGQDPPPCMAAADVDGDGEVGGSVTDVIYYANWAFLGGSPPPPPFPACGLDERPGAAPLGCDQPSPGCQTDEP